MEKKTFKSFKYKRNCCWNDSVFLPRITCVKEHFFIHLSPQFQIKKWKYIKSLASVKKQRSILHPVTIYQNKIYKDDIFISYTWKKDVKVFRRPGLKREHKKKFSEIKRAVRISIILWSQTDLCATGSLLHECT